jgi:hypothetical protein
LPLTTDDYVDHLGDWQVNALARFSYHTQSRQAGGHRNSRGCKGYTGGKDPSGMVQPLRPLLLLISSRALQLYVGRQKLTLKGGAKPLDDDATLVAAGVLDGSEVVVKDLGPQVSWRTVFLVEYVSFFLACALPPASPLCVANEKKKKNISGRSSRHSPDLLLSAQRVLSRSGATQSIAKVRPFFPFTC